MLPYVRALALVAVATLLTVSIKPLQERTSTALLFVAVLLSSYIDGLGPSLFAVLTSCLAWVLFLVPPEYSFAVESHADVLRLVLFVGIALLSSSFQAKLARAKRELARQRARLDLALEAADMGVWDYDLTRDEFWISPDLHDIFGTREEDFSPTYGGFLSFVHPDDRTAVVRNMTTAGQSGHGYQFEYRIIRRRDNITRWIATRGRTIADDHGRAARMIGLVIDVTDRRAASATAVATDAANTPAAANAATTTTTTKAPAMAS